MDISQQLRLWLKVEKLQRVQTRQTYTPESGRNYDGMTISRQTRL